MTMKSRLPLIAVFSALLGAAPAYSQTAAEQLQKGIFSQETAGDLDGAISIYRQLVNTGSTPRDIAAQAQYRMTEALLEKGDLSGASAEFEKLARNYADYAALVRNLAVGRGPTGQQEVARRELGVLDAQMRAAADAKKAQALASTNPGEPAALRVGGDVQQNNLISQPKPLYPALAKAARVQGTVRFEATIDKEGRIANLQLLSGPPLLVQAALEAVRQWTYRPTLLNGQPVTVVTTVDVNFTLSQ
jgi:TonB family protein